MLVHVSLFSRRLERRPLVVLNASLFATLDRPHGMTMCKCHIQPTKNICAANTVASLAHRLARPEQRPYRTRLFSAGAFDQEGDRDRARVEDAAGDLADVAGAASLRE